jgi:general secretion pathway protein G
MVMNLRGSWAAMRRRLVRGRSARGFTLIELLVVITLIVVLSSVALVGYRNSVILAREATLKDDLFKMREAIEQYYADKNTYPPSLDSLVSDGYMRALPVDPFTRSASSWQAIPSEPDPNNPTATPGVSDVKSGAEETAIDGSRYSEW